MDVPEAARSRGVQAGPALRRLIVTPTFAAGLGVVVAASLAVSMTAKTVLHFTGPDQQKCTLRVCPKGPGNPGGVGTLASAKPGFRLLPATSGPSGSSQPHSASSGGQGRGHVAGSHVVIAYRTTQKWSWGFDSQIMISGIPASSAGNWRLGFSYPGTSIVEVQGAQWVPTGQNSGVAEAGTSSSSAPSSGGTSSGSPSSTGTSSGGTTSPSGASSSGASPSGTSQNKPDVSGGTTSGSEQQPAQHGGQQSTVVITIEASGPPSAPSNCRFDNAPCSFR